MIFLLKHPAAPFISVLAFWLITSFLIPRSDYLLLFFGFVLSAIALLLSLIPIIYSIITRNRHNIPLIFFKLSKLPFLIIVAHILVQISGRTYTEEGGWWVLYLLLAICLPLSALLWAISLAVRKHIDKKVYTKSSNL